MTGELMLVEGVADDKQVAEVATVAWTPGTYIARVISVQGVATVPFIKR